MPIRIKQEKVNEAFFELFHALEAIRARVNGEWDNSSLTRYGPMSLTADDIARIAEDALKPYRNAG